MIAHPWRGAKDSHYPPHRGLELTAVKGYSSQHCATLVAMQDRGGMHLIGDHSIREGASEEWRVVACADTNMQEMRGQLVFPADWGEWEESRGTYAGARESTTRIFSGTQSLRGTYRYSGEVTCGKVP